MTAAAGKIQWKFYQFWDSRTILALYELQSVFVSAVDHELMNNRFLPFFLATELTKKAGQTFTAENPEKRAREDTQRQQQTAQQVRDCHQLITVIQSEQSL